MTEKLESLFQALSLEEMNEVLPRLVAIRAEAADALRAELRAKLKALDLLDGRAPKAPKLADGRSSPKPKYRSLQDPSLTWAGRGQKPKWLVAEMKASKKPLAAFAVS